MRPRSFVFCLECAYRGYTNGDASEALAKHKRNDCPFRCKHERLNEEGVCRSCGEDCRGIHS
jgi:hypothetical protein